MPIFAGRDGDGRRLGRSEFRCLSIIARCSASALYFAGAEAHAGRRGFTTLGAGGCALRLC